MEELEYPIEIANVSLTDEPIRRRRRRKSQIPSIEDQLRKDIYNEVSNLHSIRFKQHLLNELSDVPFTKKYKNISINDIINTRDIGKVNIFDEISFVTPDNYHIYRNPYRFEILSNDKNSIIHGDISHSNTNNKLKHFVSPHFGVNNYKTLAGAKTAKRLMDILADISPVGSLIHQFDVNEFSGPLQEKLAHMYKNKPSNNLVGLDTDIVKTKKHLYENSLRNNKNKKNNISFKNSPALFKYAPGIMLGGAGLYGLSQDNPGAATASMLAGATGQEVSESITQRLFNIIKATPKLTTRAAAGVGGVVGDFMFPRELGANSARYKESKIQKMLQERLAQQEPYYIFGE